MTSLTQEPPDDRPARLALLALVLPAASALGDDEEGPSVTADRGSGQVIVSAAAWLKKALTSYPARPDRVSTLDGPAGTD